MAEKLKVQDLIPEHWEGIYIESREELRFLGRNNVYCLWEHWREQRRRLESEIDWLRMQIDVTDGKKRSDEKDRELQDERTDLIAESKDMDIKICLLESLVETPLEEKPRLVPSRLGIDFKEGEDVMFFVPQFDGVFPEKVGTFVSGVVMARKSIFTGDTAVPIRVSVPIHSGGNLDGFGVNCTSKMPELMKKWEYDYFKANPDFFLVWASNLSPGSVKAYNFDIEVVAKAMATT